MMFTRAAHGMYRDGKSREMQLLQKKQKDERAMLLMEIDQLKSQLAVMRRDIMELNQKLIEASKHDDIDEEGVYKLLRARRLRPARGTLPHAVSTRAAAQRSCSSPWP